MLEKTDVVTKFELVLEQYKSLQAETLLRIGENHKLLFFKMASCGALFSFILARVSSDTDSNLVFGSLLAPLIALMVDFLIVNNLNLIGVMGYYVATFIEKRYFPEGFEVTTDKTHFFKAKPVTWLTDWLVMIGSTLVIYMLTAVILLNFGRFGGSFLFWPCIILCGVFFFVLFVWDFYNSMRSLKIDSDVAGWLKSSLSRDSDPAQRSLLSGK